MSTFHGAGNNGSWHRVYLTKVVYAHDQHKTLEWMPARSKVKDFVTNANEFYKSVATQQQAQPPGALVPMQMERPQESLGSTVHVPANAPQFVTAQVPPGAGPGATLLAPTPNGGSVRYHVLFLIQTGSVFQVQY